MFSNLCDLVEKIQQMNIMRMKNTLIQLAQKVMRTYSNLCKKPPNNMTPWRSKNCKLPHKFATKEYRLKHTFFVNLLRLIIVCRDDILINNYSLFFLLASLTKPPPPPITLACKLCSSHSRTTTTFN